MPAVITLSLPPSGILLDGMSAAEACKKLEDAGAAVVGLNCGMGPPTMLPLLKEIAKVCKVVSYTLAIVLICLRPCYWRICHPLMIFANSLDPEPAHRQTEKKHWGKYSAQEH